jgi:rhodanese-related sulfurtransferase
MQAHLLIIFTQNSIKEITPIELKALIDSSVDFQLIDVREAHELAVANIGGEHIPLGVITQNADKGNGQKYAQSSRGSTETCDTGKARR